MELIDVYDADFKKTGKTVPRGTALSEDEYVLCVHVLIQDMEGRFLVQKRSEKKRNLPGHWDVTAGAADAGEDGCTAAIREAREEVGLELPPEKMQLIFRDCIHGSFYEAWHVQLPFTLEDCTMQESEVQELRLAQPEELLRILEDFPYRSEEYKRKIESFLGVEEPFSV
ncbi:MAG: NUDIX domain-containing protein [Ruminococcus sp.]|nr:NUDIX domain-containing protein [Ruminococcus sp.]